MNVEFSGDYNRVFKLKQEFILQTITRNRAQASCGGGREDRPASKERGIP